MEETLAMTEYVADECEMEDVVVLRPSLGKGCGL
jgi:hypothetical protein